MVYSTLHPLEELLTIDRGDTVCSIEKYGVHLRRVEAAALLVGVGEDGEAPREVSYETHQRE